MVDELKKAAMDSLREMGVETHDYAYERTHSISRILEEFSEATNEPGEEVVRVAGRIRSIRGHGKVLFVDLSDMSARMQLFVRKNDIDEGMDETAFNTFKKNISKGDFVGVSGRPFRTKMGELSIWVSTYTLLTKSLLDLPEVKEADGKQFQGLRNVEMRYRQRYLDLAINQDVRDTFVKRSRIVRSIREWLDRDDFLEVEVPILSSLASGAAARPFKTYHNFMETDLYMRVAPELHLKRLLVGGFEKVYEMARCFRNEDIDSHHNPEFTMLEAYVAYMDYEGMMKLVEALIKHTVQEALGTKEVTFQGTTLDFSRPFRKLSMYDALKEYTDIDVSTINTLEEARTLAQKHQVELKPGITTVAEVAAEMFDSLVEDKLIEPTYIIHHPKEISTLSKKLRGNPALTERFELYMMGFEVANGFSELNDPIDQRERFEGQMAKRAAGDDEALPIDEDFITALEYGMPPAAGVGIGIDRLVMFLTDSPSIKDVILYPQMRPLKEGDDDTDTPSPEEKEESE